MVYPNTEENFQNFRWKQYGNKRVNYDETKNKFNRKYFKCTSPGCDAKRKIHYLDSGNKVEYVNSHNHEPPENPRVRPEVKEKGMLQLKAKGKPSLIYQQMVNEAPLPISKRDVPTKRQIYHWSEHLASSNLPTSMNIHILFEYHINTFIQTMPSPMCL